MTEQEITKFNERKTFLLTTTLFMPLITVTLVGALGFVVWLSQSISS